MVFILGSIFNLRSKEAAELLDNSDFALDAYDCMNGADAVDILTEWNQFRALDLKRMKTLMNEPVLIDLRNIYPLDEVKEFDYHSIGRPTS